MMKKDKERIIYIPEPDQQEIAWMVVRYALVKDIIARGMLADDFVKSYNEIRKVEAQQKEKIIQI